MLAVAARTPALNPEDINMAATADITLADYSSTNKTFSPSIAVANGSQYADVASTASQPRTLQIKHIMQPANASTGVDVHTVSFAHTVLDSVTSKPYTASVGLTIRVPRVGPTLANRRDLWTFIKNFLTDTNVEKLLIGGF